MKTTIKTHEDIDRLVAQCFQPSIISICKDYSFGAFWLRGIFESISETPVDQYTCFIEDQQLATSLLGSGQPLLIYFVKDQEVKEKLSSSSSKSIFKEKLASILDG